MLRLPRLLTRRRSASVGGYSSHEQAQAARIAELTRSRRAIADAYEVERQRIERDLHDGTQQYLVAASIKLGEAALEATGPSAALIDAALADLRAGLHSLRATVRGIHPQVLAERGLAAAVADVAATYGPHVSIQVPHPLPKLSPSVLAAAYFFTTEALTNAAKHAPGAEVSVLLTADQDLNVTVVDDGPGGATMVPGHGIAGMHERLVAFGGGVHLISPPGGPTRLRGTIPLLLERGQSGLPAEYDNPQTDGGTRL